jgi:hypothetical protein
MPRSITSAQRHLINSGTLDLIGEDKSGYQVIELNDLAETMAWLGALYVQKLTENLNKADATSSGKLADSIIPLDVKIFGSVYTVEIEAAKYAKFLDEGVDGWAKSRGSQYQFKTKGVDPKGEMVKEVKAWLMREGRMSRNVKTQLSNRETKQKSIVDASTRQAISVAYMIKRQGIKPTHFWKDTARQMKSIVEVELGKALKVDIINSIVA